MAGAKKHMERSHYSYHSKPNFSHFHRKAVIKSDSKYKKSLLSRIMEKLFKHQSK